jgi:hypothetical protein
LYGRQPFSFGDVASAQPEVRGDFHVSKAENGTFLRAKYWQDRAEEAWSLASQMVDPEAKTTLIEIAERYDALADSMVMKEALPQPA